MSDNITSDKIEVIVKDKTYTGELRKIIYKNGQMNYLVKFKDDKGVIRTELFKQEEVKR